MNSPLEYASQICYSSREVLQFTHDQAVRFKDTPGVYCELGCAAGAQVIALAFGAPNKTIYAFDSWEGIPNPSNRDNQYPGIRIISEAEQRALPNPGEQVLESSGATVVSLESFKEHCFNSGVGTRNIKPIQGWFEETVPNFNRESIALLRLDGDLFHSTWVCLQHLFPKLSKGSVCIIDDWTLPGCRAACEEYFALIGYEPDYQFLSTIAYFYK